MASPITTSGFHVQAQPGMSYLPASAFVSNAGGIIPAISQGAGLVSQLAQISDEAQLAPLRRQLQQIQLQEAQNRLADAPLNRQLQLAQIAHATQPLERVLGTELKRIPRINSPEDTPAMDENGNPTFAEGDTNYDLTPVQRIEVRDPITGSVTVQQRTLAPIATAEQLGDRADKLEIQRLQAESLAANRDANRQLAIERLNSPKWKRLGYGVDPVTGKQAYLIVNETTGERQSVPTDLVPVPTGQDALLAGLQKLTGGGPSNIAAPVVNIPAVAAAAVAPEDTPAMDAETKQAIDDLSGRFVVPAAPATPAFKSADQVRAAFKAGSLPRAEAEKILREQFGLK